MADKSEITKNNSKTIYDDLLNKIIQLEYKPGEKISENELAAYYHTTRHNIRGALSVLKEKEFVEIYPQKGTFVSLMNINKLKHALFIREAVEQEAFYEIITNGIDPKFIKAMKKNIEKQKKIGGAANDPDTFFKMNDDFHVIIVEATGKKDALMMLKDAHMHTQRWRNLGMGNVGKGEHLIADHEKIVEAIESKNWRAGREIIHSHINAVDQYNEIAIEKHPNYFA